jgi:hypothetical protein
VYLTGDDITKRNLFPDSCVSCTWTIDIHYPEPKQASEAPGQEFMSIAKHGTYQGGPYPIPYRCFYSRNVPNLFMAGRDISVDHTALGPVRVQGTTGMMGEVVGRAASLCKKYDCTPREVYTKHLDELIGLFSKRLSDTPMPETFKGFTNDLTGKVGENVAPKAKITAPEPMVKDTAKFINDSDETPNNAKRWVTRNEPPINIEFTWDKPQTISAARIVTGYFHDAEVTDPINDFVLQWYDGKEWQDIPGTRVADNEDYDWSAQFNAVTANRVRLLIEKSPVNTTRLWEVQLFAPK